jgi:hypothetical protein
MHLDIAEVVQVLDEVSVNCVSNLIPKLLQPILAPLRHHELGESSTIATGEMHSTRLASLENDTSALEFCFN